MTELNLPPTDPEKRRRLMRAIRIVLQCLRWIAFQPLAKASIELVFYLLMRLLSGG